MRYYVTQLHGGLQIRDSKTGADVPCDFQGCDMGYDAAREIARLMDDADERVRKEMEADAVRQEVAQRRGGAEDLVKCDGCSAEVPRLDLYPVGGENDRMMCPVCANWP